MNLLTVVTKQQVVNFAHSHTLLFAIKLLLKRKHGGHFSHEHVCLRKVFCSAFVQCILHLMNSVQRPACKSGVFIHKVTKNEANTSIYI